MTTRKEGWQKSVDAAHRAFGTRHYKFVLAVETGKRAAPFVAGGAALAGLIYGAAWLYRHTVAHAHAPAPWLWILLGGLSLLAAVGTVAWHWLNSATGRLGGKVAAMFTAAGLVLFAIAWKD